MNRSIQLALVIAMSGYASSSPADICRQIGREQVCVKPYHLGDDMLERWAEENERYITILCSSSPGTEHRFAFSKWSIVVSTDAKRVAKARLLRPDMQPIFIVSCTDRTMERVPPLESEE